MKLAIAITPKNGCLGIRLIIYHYWLHLIACDFLVLYYGILKWISSIGSRAIHMRHFCNLYAVYTRRCNTVCTLLHISQSRYLTANIQCTICLYPVVPMNFWCQWWYTHAAHASCCTLAKGSSWYTIQIWVTCIRVLIHVQLAAKLFNPL